MKKKGWKADAGPLGEVLGCRGTAWLDTRGEQSPRLGAVAGGQPGPWGSPGLAHTEAVVMVVGTVAGLAVVVGAGKVSSLLQDVGVQMLSASGADGQGLGSLWEAEEMEVLSFWDSAKLPGMLSSL